MSILKRVKCKSPNCMGIITIPVHIVIKERQVINVARCPNCKRSYKIVFSLGEMAELIDFARTYLYFCDVCGANNSDSWRYRGGSQMHGNRERIVVTCTNCGKKRTKTITTEIWDELDVGSKNLEVGKCKCGAPIIRNSKFCNQCGSRWEGISLKSESFKTRTCPVCHEPYRKGTIYCIMCGQELNCKICGAKISKEVTACSQCGREVKKSFKLKY